MRYKTLLPKATLLSVLMASMLLLGAPGAHAAPKPTSINLVPTIQSITIQPNGPLVASGPATAVIHGKTFTPTFSNRPANFAFSTDQTGPAATGPPIHALSHGPYNRTRWGLCSRTH